MNVVAIVGRLTKDVEVRYSQGEKATAVARFSVAVDRRFNNKEQSADFINCVAFGKTAEFLGSYFFKGMRIGLTGRIQTGNYTNKDGVKVYTTDVIADNVEFVESKKEREENPQPVKDDGFVNVADSIGEEELPFF